MADRTSAELFSFFFKMLARNPTDEHKQMAAEAFQKAGEYDFSDYQMDCDDALVALQLARKRARMHYGPEGNER